MGTNAVDSLRVLSGIQGDAKPLPSTPIYSLLLKIGPVIFRSIFRIKTIGMERIPKKGPVIIAGNHLAHVDPILMIVGYRRTVRFLSKKEHYDNVFTRFVMNTTGQIETDREAGGKDALIQATEVLRTGQAMGIFPEGTRSRRTEKPFLLPGKTGIARLAASYPNSVVIPIAMIGSREMMAPKKHKLPRLWKPIKINFGKGITWIEWLSDPNGGNITKKDLSKLKNMESNEIKSQLATLYRKFTDQIMNSITELGAP